MTVAELIKALEACPPEATVLMFDSWVFSEASQDHAYCGIDSVEQHGDHVHID